MILPNNPAIDVDELMKRVRSDAARIRVSGAIEDRRGEPRNANELTLARALDRHRTVTALLTQAEKENMPRTSVPRRIASIRALAPVVKAALKVYNYAFKQQREFNLSMVRSGREMIFMQAIIGEAVARISEELRSMERYRTETFREIRATLGTVVDRLSGLEHSHHTTRTRADDALARVEELTARLNFAHERVDSAEASIRALSTAIENGTRRSAFAHERIDSTETTLRTLSERLQASPTSGEVRLQIVDALRDVERRIAVGDEALLRSDAILRGELLALRNSGSSAVLETTPDALVARPGTFEAVHAAIGDAFRSDRRVVSERLAVYVPVIEAAGTVTADHPLLDIGSGRGEWLGLLRERGLAARGCESSALLAGESIAAGFDVRHADGLDDLRAAETGSLGAVTAFHVVEHLTFDDLCTLLLETQRALAPGGVLILETPDPRNILVSTRTFYLDPTHRHPVPAELLEFLAAAFGYSQIEQRELHPPDVKLFSDDDPTGQSLNALFSRAQDYAVIARAPRA